MPVNTDYRSPFIPQEGISAQVLAGIQAANENFAKQRGLNLQAQELPSLVTQREAEARRLDAQTSLDQMQIKLRTQLMGALLGGGQPAAAPSPQDQLANVAQGKPATPPKGGILGDTYNFLASDTNLTDNDKNLLKSAYNQGILKVFGGKPEDAADELTNAYNGILTRRGENERAIKVEENQPDSKSPTGYSKVATRPDGTEAYRLSTQPPVPKNLEESTSYLGSAQLAYQHDPTPGNKAALELFKKQHDSMYADHLHEVSQNAETAARARGADVEAMYRTGKNPLTGEVLGLNNAPPGALVNAKTGQVVPQDMVGLYKPDQQERQTADTARQVLAIESGLRDQIAKHPELIGPLAGRSQEGLQKAGLSSHDASKMIDDINFLQSANTKMHTGRFSSEILQKMGNMVKPGMNKDEFLGALDSVHDVASRYADEDKLTTVYDYQQRQMFENQGNGGAKPTQPSAASGGVPSGATHIVPGPDGKNHYTNAAGTVDLGVAP